MFLIDFSKFETFVYIWALSLEIDNSSGPGQDQERMRGKSRLIQGATRGRYLTPIERSREQSETNHGF